VAALIPVSTDPTAVNDITGVVGVSQAAAIEPRCRAVARRKGITVTWKIEGYEMGDWKTKYGYAWQHFHSAARTLAESSDSIQRRLRNAYVLALIRLQKEQLPPPLQNDFSAIISRLKAEPASESQGGVDATMRSMSDDDAEDLATKIFDMFLLLHDG
jgi:hypothetical protein